MRAMLDERGVEYETFSGAFATKTCWPCANGLAAIFVEYDEGTTRFEMSRWHVAPEQAIAATLEDETCFPALNSERNGLLSCPFCGGKAYLFWDSDNDNPFFDDGTSEGYWQVKHNCEMPSNAEHYFVDSDFLCFRTPWYKDKQKAIAIWNRRDGWDVPPL